MAGTRYAAGALALALATGVVPGTARADAPPGDPILQIVESILAAAGGRPVDVTGEIVIHAYGVLGTTIEYRNFNPPRDQWQCSESTNSVTCVPNSTQGNTRYVCRSTVVYVENYDAAPVTGRSHCSGFPAVATVPSQSSGAGSASPGGDAPWTCGGDPPALVYWRITCLVG
jgi:hypothetical protein